MRPDKAKEGEIVMELQKQFVESVRLYFKKEGEAWLEKLPDLIAYCEEKWALQLETPFSLSINYVAPAVRADGTELVVKISLPGAGFLDEWQALQLFNGEGMASLVDVDQEHGILLIEKLTLGYTLAEMEVDEEACQIAVHVLKKLHRPAPKNTCLPTTKAREDNLKAILGKNPNGLGPISKETLEKASRLFTYLNETSQNQRLLHGDFHHYNVLASGKDDWTAIDPKGLIGETEYDLIQFLLNKLPEKGKLPVIEKRVEIFTEELNLNKERLLMWGYCHTVLAASWTVDDKGRYDQTFVEAIEVFEKLLS
ncbi:aminoglycoside phosphotransferase family protein [Thalassobacillus devorans]|uniref:aminoglycoside phosphotransferase family protein n=1 Tax=Thalassobacillus devorans TaxID=279813 RepID=UPI0004BBF2E0|nr:aminoglycoside phosphotransferase family protein [Thalassobacillus devorans]